MHSLHARSTPLPYTHLAGAGLEVLLEAHTSLVCQLAALASGRVLLGLQRKSIRSPTTVIYRTPDNRVRTHSPYRPPLAGSGTRPGRPLDRSPIPRSSWTAAAAEGKSIITTVLLGYRTCLNWAAGSGAKVTVCDGTTTTMGSSSSITSISGRRGVGGSCCDWTATLQESINQ